MQKSEEMYKEQNSLLKTFMELNMPVSTVVTYTAKMRNVSETEKEAFAKELWLKLQPTIKEL